MLMEVITECPAPGLGPESFTAPRNRESITEGAAGGVNGVVGTAGTTAGMRRASTEKRPPNMKRMMMDRRRERTKRLTVMAMIAEGGGENKLL